VNSSKFENSGLNLSSMTIESLVQELRRKGSPKARVGMSRFGIQTDKAFGVSIPQLRDLAKKVGTDHDLALKYGKQESTRRAYSPV